MTHFIDAPRFPPVSEVQPEVTLNLLVLQAACRGAVRQNLPSLRMYCWFRKLNA